MGKERWSKVVVKEENMDEEYRKSKKDKQEKIEQEEDTQKENDGHRRKGEEKRRKVEEKSKQKVEEEKQKDQEEINKEEEKNQEKGKKRKKLLKKKEKTIVQEKSKEGVKDMNILPQFFKIIFPKKPIEKLRIPQAFNKFLGNESLGVVSLKGPSGNTWHAKLVLDSEGFYFTHGWNEFIIDHDINIGEILVFSYDGHSQFSIRIFDLTACQKETAFLARPCNNVTVEGEQGLMVTNTANTSQCSHEVYKGHNTMGGLLEDVNAVRNYAANNSEYNDPGEAMDVWGTLQHGERENMDKDTHHTSDTFVDPRRFEKTRKMDDIIKRSDSIQREKDKLSRASLDNRRKGSRRTKPRKSIKVLSSDRSMKDVPRKDKGSP